MSPKGPGAPHRWLWTGKDALSQSRAEFVLEDGEDPVHGIFHVRIRQGLLDILQYKIHGILLLPRRNLVPAVDIEERNALEQLLAGLERGLAEVRIRDGLVQEQRQAFYQEAIRRQREP